MPNSAPKVPVLPDVVTVAYCSDQMTGLASVPIGVEKESLKVRSIDLTRNTAHVIMGAELTDIKNFASMFVKELSNCVQKNCYVFDAEKIVGDFGQYVTYYDNNILDNFKAFGKTIFDMYSKYKDSGFDVESLKDDPSYVCVIVGIDKFKTLLGGDFDGAFSGLLTMVKGMPKVSFVIIDTADNIKKREFEGWYKDTLPGTRGVWVGNGVANQYTLKSTLPSRVLSAKVEKDFGYYIDGNTTVLVKLISEVGEEEVYETL